MNSIHFEIIPLLPKNYSFDLISDLLDEKGVTLPIDQMNWKDKYPASPQVNCRMGYNEQALFLKFNVKEDSFRANELDDNGKIWEDSCVEFFVQPDMTSPLYYNFEFNAIGSLLIGCGTQRAERILADIDTTNSVRRNTKLFVTRGTTLNLYCWELIARIPYSAFFHTHFSLHKGKIIKANLYKCGNKLSIPHFLTWQPICTENPDFHRPEFFGTLIFNA